MGKRDTRTGKTVAVVGGGALLAWLLFRRGKGWRFGRGGSARAPAARGGPPCRVHLVAGGILVDGEHADLPQVVATCQRSGQAEVTASGAAIVGAIADTIAALKEAGVVVHADPGLWDLTGIARPGGRPS
jgi:hypothetical protein